VVIGLGLFAGTCLLGQETFLATIRGTALDPSGAVVPEVSLTLVKLDTNLTRTATASAAGDFEFPYLQRGTYRLTATHAGFKTFVADNIILESSQIRRIDLQLVIGDAQTQVTVTADAAVISTEGGTVSGMLTAKKYDIIPLVATFTDPTWVLTTLAGVIASNGGGYPQQFNGQSVQQLQMGVDGVTEDAPVNQTNDMEFVEELVAVTTNASAEYSRAANFGLITKSGGNKLHGRLLYSEVNEALNARDYFSPTKPATRIHTLGVNVGGPIVKDKTFFYFGWLRLIVPSHGFKLAGVPTADFRNGNFSSLLADGIIVRDPLTGIPFEGNVIPQGRLSSTALNIQNGYYPAPNLGSADSTVNNFGWLHPKADDISIMNDYLWKIDHKFSEKNTLSGRLIERWCPYWLSGGLPQFGWTRSRHHSTLALSDTHVFSPRVVNTFRFSWVKNHMVDGETNFGFTPPNGNAAVEAIGLQGVNPKGYTAMGFPSQSITGFTGLWQYPGGVNIDDRDLEFKDSLTWVFGKHILKFGGELRTLRSFNGQVPDGTYGSFGFDGAFSGYSYADFLLGLPHSSYRVDPLTNRVRTAHELGLFITDTFKVTSKLTLDMGLRWDYFATPRYQDGLQYNWDPTTGNVVVPADAVSEISPLYPSNISIVTGNVFPTPRKTNFRPRFGASYMLAKNTVLRGAFGVYSGALGRFYRTQGGGPYQLGESYDNVIVPGAPSHPLFQYPNPFPAFAGAIASQGVGGYPLQTSNGDIYQFNLSLEQQWHNLGFRLSYIGSRDYGLETWLSMNSLRPSTTPFDQSHVPYPQFVSAGVAKSDGASKYNALQFEVQRKVGTLTIDAHYTWAHNMANYLNTQNPYDPLPWNQDAVTPRHRVVMNIGYTLPIGKGHRWGSSAPILNHIVGGWTIYYVGYLQTGQFFTPYFSGSDPSGTNSWGGVPDRIANGNLPAGQRTIQKWFDASAFAVPADGQFGNSGVNILEGPRYNAHHMSFNKDWNLTERFRLEFSWHISNIFNHPNFCNPLSNISDPGTAGLVYTDVSHWDSQKGGARWMEGKLRLFF
jgi:hypothetical protein